MCSASIGPSGVPTSSAGRASPAAARAQVGVAVEAVLAGVVAGLDLDQADVEPGVAVAGEAQRAGDVDRADDRVGGDVVDGPCARRGPGPAPRRPGPLRPPRSPPPTTGRSAPSGSGSTGRPRARPVRPGRSPGRRSQPGIAGAEEHSPATAVGAIRRSGACIRPAWEGPYRPAEGESASPQSIQQVLNIARRPSSPPARVRSADVRGRRAVC